MNPLLDVAEHARRAQRKLGSADSSLRRDALLQLSVLLKERSDEILEANARDSARAEIEGISAPLLSRLRLNQEKLDTLATGLEQLAATEDPVGRKIRRTRLDDGLILEHVMSPIGVLLVIFESRPDAIIQIAGLAIRSGNAVILKGGREAQDSNRALIRCVRAALSAVGLADDAVQGVADRDSISALLELDQHIDLVIPRGSGALVRHIQENTRIPVLGHAEGVCSLYLDKEACPQMAARLVVDGKCSYPSACNATETLLVHQDFLGSLDVVGRALRDANVEMRADPRALSYLPEAIPAVPSDGSTEYGDRILAIRTVDSLEAAIEFIHTHGSGHTESICTDDRRAADQFLKEVDSASVFHNASTRFADGYRYGLGAEVGISTGRIHARGPVGVEGLMTTRWLLRGQGQCTADYGPEGRRFVHANEPL